MEKVSSDGFSKYQHLESLSKVPDIFLEPEVVCTEKIHGTNARVGWINGEERIGGRNQDHTKDEGDSGVMGFVKYIRSLNVDWAGLFGTTNIIFYGEWHGSNIQKGIKYSDEKEFRVFDVRVNGLLRDWNDIVDLVEHSPFKLVPLLYKGVPTLEKFDELVKVQSVVGKENGFDDSENFHEGIVIKPTKMKRAETGWVMAKYKHARWTERQSEKVKKDYKPLPGEVTAFVEEFVTDIRFDHIIDHLRDQGVEINDMKATPHLLKEMNIDVAREGKDEIEKITNDEVTWKMITKLISKKTLVLLREYLHKKMIDASK